MAKRKRNTVAKTAKKKFSCAEKLSGFLGLMRTGNCLMAAIAVIIGFFLANGIFYIDAALGMISAFLVCGAGQAINDYFDAKIDLRTSKERPIPSGRVSGRQALYFSLILFIIGVFVSSMINNTAFLIAIIFSILLIAYPLFLNRVKYVGNIIVALGTAFTLIFGAASAGIIPLLVIVLAASAFFSNMGREITKDIEDLKKDKGAKTTLPMLTKKARHFVSIYYAIGIALSYFAFYAFALGNLYLMLVAIAALIFIYATYVLYKGAPKRSQKFSKKGMLISLIGFILAAVK